MGEAYVTWQGVWGLLQIGLLRKICPRRWCLRWDFMDEKEPALERAGRRPLYFSNKQISAFKRGEGTKDETRILLSERIFCTKNKSPSWQALYSTPGQVSCYQVAVSSATYFYGSLNFFSEPMVAQRLKHLPAVWETWVQSLGWEYPLEKEMATHSSILAWRTPWTEEPGGL